MPYTLDPEKAKKYKYLNFAAVGFFLLGLILVWNGYVGTVYHTASFWTGFTLLLLYNYLVVNSKAWRIGIVVLMVVAAATDLGLWLWTRR